MYTIGEFARLGRVSVRMLRHYDTIGLLVPAQVDSGSGYRRYERDQLGRLHRIVALKELGFTLEQVAAMLDESISADQLAGMLRLRKAELSAQMADDARRLARVEARRRSIQREGQMTTTDVVMKEIASVRVAELSGVGEGLAPEHIGPVIQPLFADLGRRLHEAGVSPCGPGIAYYEPSADGDSIIIHAAFPIDGEAIDGLDVVQLPAMQRAATLVHRGSMDACQPSYDALEEWIADHGLRSIGLSREISFYCPTDNEDEWVTELQIEVADAG